jgi:hypothetical protein
MLLTFVTIDKISGKMFPLFTWHIFQITIEEDCGLDIFEQTNNTDGLVKELVSKRSIDFQRIPHGHQEYQMFSVVVRET